MSEAQKEGGNEDAAEALPPLPPSPVDDSKQPSDQQHNPEEKGGEEERSDEKRDKGGEEEGSDEKQGDEKGEEEGGDEKQGEENGEGAAVEVDLSDEDLKCAICRDYFCLPVTVTCQHTFCQPCLEQLKTIQNEENDFQAQEWNGHQLLSCPICRRMFPMGPLSARNTIVERLVISSMGGRELYEQRSSAAHRQMLQRLMAREDRKRSFDRIQPIMHHRPHFHAHHPHPVHQHHPHIHAHNPHNPQALYLQPIAPAHLSCAQRFRHALDRNSIFILVLILATLAYIAAVLSGL